MSERAVVRQRMEIKDKQRRIDVASSLFAEGYTVRPVEVKPAGKNVKKYFVEYWKEEN